MGYALFQGRLDAHGNELDDNQPLDVGAVTTTLNNIAWHYDASAQPRIKMIAAGSDYIQPASVAAADTWYRIIEIPITMKMRPDNQPMGLRTRIAGFISNASYTATFRTVLTVPQRLASRVQTGSYVGLFDVTTSSTSSAWLGNEIMRPAASDVSFARKQFSTRDNDTDDRFVTGDWFEYVFAVYAKTTNVAGIPRLTGIDACEFSDGA